MILIVDYNHIAYSFGLVPKISGKIILVSLSGVLDQFWKCNVTVGVGLGRGGMEKWEREREREGSRAPKSRVSRDDPTWKKRSRIFTNSTGHTWRWHFWKSLKERERKERQRACLCVGLYQGETWTYTCLACVVAFAGPLPLFFSPLNIRPRATAMLHKQPNRRVSEHENETCRD